MAAARDEFVRNLSLSDGLMLRKTSAVERKSMMMTKLARSCAMSVCLMTAVVVPKVKAEEPLRDKTLVVWTAPANLAQRGGSPLSLQDEQDRFDAIVFGEITPEKWMAGSDFFRRTNRTHDNLISETASPATLVQIAITYHDRDVVIYRNGKEYSRHQIPQAQVFGSDSLVMFGPRHRGVQQFFAGEIDDARIYDKSLSAEEVASLKPNVEGPIKPWAWWNFEQADPIDQTGRFVAQQLTGGAVIKSGRLILNGTGATLAVARTQDQLSLDPFGLNLHLVHPGADSSPGDPNAAFCLDGTYHLHYILRHPYKGRESVSFVHLTSPDMLHWTWESTKLQPAFTGHGMFSGTGFLTRDGKPAAIYHGHLSGRNQIAIAKNRKLSEWEKPYVVHVTNPDGSEAKIEHWDPDCFLIGDTYYAISGGTNPPLMKSTDLKNWKLIGNFLAHELPDVAIGEDISCPNFFPIGDKWVLLCISHTLGCRYYIGDWDAKAEKFVPEKHGRMNFRRDDQPVYGLFQRTDFFAPESLLTKDGRRVMWAWLTSIGSDNKYLNKTIQSLPRELSLAADHSLRIRPLRELETLRYEPQKLENVSLSTPITGPFDKVPPVAAPQLQAIVEQPGDTFEIKITIPKAEAERKLFGFVLFSDGKGNGLPLIFRPESGTIRVGAVDAPFKIADLGPDEDLELRIFVDRYVVEVFVNDRQGLVAVQESRPRPARLDGFTTGAKTDLKSIEVWKLKPTNEGYLKAKEAKNWEPLTTDSK